MKTKPAARAEPPTREAGVRLDKWLWAARFYKTRALACEAVERGRVKVNDAEAKPGRTLRCGDRIALRQGDCPLPRIVTVQMLSEVRGPAPVAQQLYLDDPAAQAAIAQWSAQRHYAADPALAIEHGRPTKSDRRQLAQWQRWSATLDDESD